jgi:hypothetical protein
MTDDACIHEDFELVADCTSGWRAGQSGKNRKADGKFMDDVMEILGSTSLASNIAPAATRSLPQTPPSH